MVSTYIRLLLLAPRREVGRASPLATPSCQAMAKRQGEAIVSEQPRGLKETG